MEIRPVREVVHFSAIPTNEISRTSGIYTRLMMTIAVDSPAITRFSRSLAEKVLPLRTLIPGHYLSTRVAI
jgi:hypothetical protein